MAMFPGNLVYKSAIQQQNRLLMIPWVKKNFGIICSKSRNYSNSGPVRYIPKKFSDPDKSNIFPLPSKHSKAKEKQNNMAKRVNFSDNSGRARMFVSDIRSQDHVQMPITKRDYGGKLDVEEENQDEFLAVDNEFMREAEEVSEEVEYDQGGDPLGVQPHRCEIDAEKKAIELLAMRAFTAMELKKKLLGKRFPLDVVEEVVTDLQRRGLINDALYAETFCRSRWSSSSWGPRRLKQALFKKGVSEVDADKAVKLVFENSESDGYQDSGVGMSQPSIDHLLVQASKQWLRSHAVPHETRKSRIVRWLQYRGFNWTVVSFVLKKLESKYHS